MNTNTSSSQPRVLSLEEFAALIRKMREIFQWSQETLAELAGLNVRTIPVSYTHLTLPTSDLV